jgi:hypothetical protein
VPKGAGPSCQTQPACHFSIACTLDGFPVTIEGDGRAGDLKLIIDRLKSVGASPPSVQASTPEKTSGAPTCPAHGSKMKEGRRGFFCPRKVGDGYCKETA